MKNKKIQRDDYETSRVLYIIEAALEYFIAILIGESYLAKVTEFIGMSDALTGVLTSFVSLGSTFQIAAIFLIGKTPVKRWITPIHLLNQSLFTFLYAVPLIEMPGKTKIVIFTACLLIGQIVSNILSPAKFNWFMGLVDDHKRGVFTANKEIVSLLSGMIFSFCMGRVVDHYEEKGDLKGAFVVMTFTIFGLMVLHTLTLVFSKEKPEAKKSLGVKDNLSELVKDRQIFKIIGVSVLWNVANYATTPFYGSYKNKELGFSMTFISILSIGYSIVRALVSRPLGRYADKHSFSSMLKICFSIEALALFINVFTVPSNGRILFPIYYALHGVALGGINSGAVNLIYDYVSRDKRTGALAIKSCLAGIAGFLSTLGVSRIVAYIQENGNEIFGIRLYAQQFASALGCVLQLVILLYLCLVIGKDSRRQDVSGKQAA